MKQLASNTAMIRAAARAGDYIDRDYGGRLAAQAKKLLQVT
jgi:hypothetical protein